MKNRGFLKSLLHAINGIKTAFKSEKNFRIEIYLGLFTLLLSYVLKVTRIEFSIILICFALVLGSELLNSSIEHIVYLASPEYHDLAKKAKDISAAAVLIISVITLIIGLIISVPKIMALL